MRLYAKLLRLPQALHGNFGVGSSQVPPSRHGGIRGHGQASLFLRVSSTQALVGTRGRRRVDELKVLVPGLVRAHAVHLEHVRNRLPRRGAKHVVFDDGVANRVSGGALLRVELKVDGVFGEIVFDLASIRSLSYYITQRQFAKTSQRLACRMESTHFPFPEHHLLFSA